MRPVCGVLIFLFWPVCYFGLGAPGFARPSTPATPTSGSSSPPLLPYAPTTRTLRRSVYSRAHDCRPSCDPCAAAAPPPAPFCPDSALPSPPLQGSAAPAGTGGGVGPATGQGMAVPSTPEAAPIGPATGGLGPSRGCSARSPGPPGPCGLRSAGRRTKKPPPLNAPRTRSRCARPPFRPTDQLPTSRCPPLASPV